MVVCSKLIISCLWLFTVPGTTITTYVSCENACTHVHGSGVNSGIIMELYGDQSSFF